MNQRVLIAGIGNIFLGDDGFGVEVAKRLASEVLLDWVRGADFGSRGLHLAYELLDTAYETTSLVDVTPRGGTPGTVYLIESDLATLDSGAYSSPDAHGMHPEAVFSFLRALGGTVGRVLIVGCEPAWTAEEIGLSEPAARAVPEAVMRILNLIQRERMD
jgi:hydrogenase maturation protease